MIQVDLFALEQAAEPVAVATEQKPICGMPASVRRKHALADTPEVRAAALAVLTTRPTEWLTWWAFRPVIEKYDISCCFGRVLRHLEQQGQLVIRRVYLGRGIGAEKPGSPNYQGFTHDYRLASAQEKIA